MLRARCMLQAARSGGCARRLVGLPGHFAVGRRCINYRYGGGVPAGPHHSCLGSFRRVCGTPADVRVWSPRLPGRVVRATERPEAFTRGKLQQPSASLVKRVGPPVRIQRMPTPHRELLQVSAPASAVPLYLHCLRCPSLSFRSTTRGHAGRGNETQGDHKALPENYAALARELRKFLRDDQVVHRALVHCWVS
jgi:hypothetical protein